MKEPVVVKVLGNPSYVDGIILRLTELSDGSGRVEQLTPAGWIPGGGDIASMLYAPPATEEDIREICPEAADALPYPRYIRTTGPWETRIPLGTRIGGAQWVNPDFIAKTKPAK